MGKDVFGRLKIKISTGAIRLEFSKKRFEFINQGLLAFSAVG